jgi:hypothetical protein
MLQKPSPSIRGYTGWGFDVDLLRDVPSKLQRKVKIGGLQRFYVAYQEDVLAGTLVERPSNERKDG